LLAPQEEGRKVNFGQHLGEPAWQEVPGEYRAMLRRLVVIQGDTEPASVEQQRHLGKTAPSLYDMRNVFQVNVEEGRHLWAMVYILQKYFGRDGREEAEELLQRRSGSADKPRMLGAFNEATPDWLSFFMFTFFTDRDGKMQLESLSQSGFDPLSRTCRFMLTEEAHHMFVGETGVGRILQRTCEAMKQAGIEDVQAVDKVRALGVIDLPTMQKKLNLHYTLSLDLFGSEVSTNAANSYNAGLKGRFQETKIEDDHRLESSTYPVLKLVDGEIKRVDEPALTAVNMRLRDDYTADCQRGLDRWNKIIERTGIDFKLALPHVAFHREIGEFRDVYASPSGEGKVAALDRRRRLHRLADETRARAGSIRRLDRAAARRHRQQAGRFRIREARGVMCDNHSHVMAGLVPAIHVFVTSTKKDVDARHKAGHDVSGFMKLGIR
jgi:benzoyl-CoA 2,3-dioxygenase component B